MSINYIEKGYWLHQEIANQGHWLNQVSGVWLSSDDAAVQSIIDGFNPLPFAINDQVVLINAAAGEARQRYVTSIPSQDATYQMKLDDCKAFKSAGYPESDLVNYPFVNAEAAAVGVSGTYIADLVIATANQWITVAAAIEGLRRGGITAVENETDWTQCKAVASGFISQIEAI